MFRTLASIILLIFLKSVFPHTCESFDNVKMTVHPYTGKPYKVNVTGCIERVAFDEKIVQIEVKSQEIPKLWRDSVRNMMHLHSVIFDDCGITSVHPGAFRNVPSLKVIKVIHGGLEIVPAGVFSSLPKLEVLKLYRNLITKIEDGAFANANTLKKIYCDYNQLTEWKRVWFTNSTNLDMMNFRHNKIKVLPKQAFYQLPKLKEIYFDYNEIETIESEAFKGVTNLEYLGLKFNRLKIIHPRVFPNEITIKTLAIGANYLNFISKKITLTVFVHKVSLDGNPWKCPCWDQILFWLYDTNGTLVTTEGCGGGNVPVCSVPKSFSTTCREVIDEDVTKTYLGSLRRIRPSLDKYCARLD